METQTQIDSTDQAQALNGKAKQTKPTKSIETNPCKEFSFTTTGFPWEVSEQNSNIIPAFFAAVSMLETAKKDAKNPFFQNSPYATLPTCLETIAKAFQPNDLVLFQPSSLTDDGKYVVGSTTILHKSGEWMAHRFTFTVGKSENPQEVGKVTSYARRYDLGCVGLVTEVDDDGNSSTKPEPQGPRNGTYNKPQQQSASTPKPVTQAQSQNKPVEVKPEPVAVVNTPALSEDEQITNLIAQVAATHNASVKAVTTVISRVSNQPKKDQITFLNLMVKDKTYGSVGNYLDARKVSLGEALEQIQKAGSVSAWMQAT